MSKYKNWENFYQHEFDIRRVKLGQPITPNAMAPCPAELTSIRE